MHMGPLLPESLSRFQAGEAAVESMKVLQATVFNGRVDGRSC